MSLLGKVLRDALPFPVHLSPLPSADVTDCWSVNKTENGSTSRTGPQTLNGLFVSPPYSLRVIWHCLDFLPLFSIPGVSKVECLTPQKCKGCCIEMWDKNENFYLDRRSSFYCTLQILCFSQMEDLWQPCVSRSVGAIFPIAFPCFMSQCHIWVILAMFQTSSLLLYLLWWSVTSDFDLLKAQMTVGIFLT